MKLTGWEMFMINTPQDDLRGEQRAGSSKERFKNNNEYWGRRITIIKWV